MLSTILVSCAIFVICIFLSKPSFFNDGRGITFRFTGDDLTPQKSAFPGLYPPVQCRRERTHLMVFY